ncbi:DJ-1 family glyoxalase III [Kosakonia sacchari]|uniref:DJ-1 family protein n=1 Tax=Kosakonia sacchari TaxID=1158459 RepID=A0A1G4YGB4_9ENTR|nr:DJ-1 family glyoxalase III [Kosakonia sacchari]AHJ73463.1 thiamine biosynthesis protein ThiJ [Kosakonia sacchari SP1]SCX51808.1 DJ-1 family protein [Kosakonia sacchari]
MKKVAVLLAPGFEEAEAIITIDILRRLQIEVETLACAESRAVVSYHNIPMVADSTLAERQQTLYDAIVLPGGPQGSVNLAANPAVLQFVEHHDAAGKFICPICSAAARVLGANGLLKGRRYVCSGDLYENVRDGEYVDAPVVEDGNLISGKGLGLAFDFALTIAARLQGSEIAARDHAEHIYYSW